MIEEAGVERTKRLDVLDAGCGTGLCGPELAPYARRLVGVDLSEGMLARAKEKQLYDALEHCEVTQYLAANRDTFDLIASADTLVYFGDLDQVVRAAAGALRAGGWLIFTLEHAVRAAENVDYRLEFHGRYAHSRAYAERILAAAGLRPHIVEADLRMESGMPVAGLLVRAAKANARSA
jgi:predicted TPR repeat methyltransferase